MPGQSIDRGETVSKPPTRNERLFREPLLHCVLLGLAVFGLHHLVSKPQDERSVILVDKVRQEELIAAYEQQLGKRPSPSEFEAYVQTWLDDEMLYREGLAIVDEDPALRSVLISRMRKRLRSQEKPPAPKEAELQTYFAAHRANFTVGATVRVSEHLIANTPDATARAREVFAALQMGAGPGTPPMEYPPQNEEQLAALYGAEDAKRIMALPMRSWQLLDSGQSVRILRVDAKTAAREPNFAEVRDAVAEAFVNAQAFAGSEQEMASIRARYVVQRTDPKP